MGVILSGHLDVPDGDIATVEAHLPNHIRLSRAEDGCISFNVCIDPQNPNRYLVDEEFTTQAAFDVHQARVESSEWGQVTAHLHREYKII
jgi:quinol monooxygenase YgiN